MAEGTGMTDLRTLCPEIVHGGRDMPRPPSYASELHKAWPDADFRPLDGAGHAGSEPGIFDRRIRATHKYAGKRP